MTDQVLEALSLKLEDKLIVIREDHLADASFILASIMSYCISNDRNICLVTFHNTIGHYHNIGKRLGFDLLNEIKESHVKSIDALKDVADDILNKNKRSKEDNTVKQLFLQIKTVTEELLQNNRPTTIILDDISHILDLISDCHWMYTFIIYCRGLIKNNISLVLNCHVNIHRASILTNTLFHSAQLAIIVSILKTGRSKKVSGRFSVNRKKGVCNNAMEELYHYKLFDKEIRVFPPGRALI